MPAKKKPTQLDRIESKLDSIKDDIKLIKALGAASDNLVEPASLQPGDYCDASKEVADELQPGDRATVNRDQWRELVELAKPHGMTYLNGDIHQNASTIGYHEGLLKMDAPRERSLPFTEFRRRLLGTIAKRKEAERAEKVGKLYDALREALTAKARG